MAAATEPFTSAGTTLGVSAALPATYDTAGFAALTFTSVGDITNFGTIGRKYEPVNHNGVTDRRTIKRKGSYDDGDMVLEMARTTGDAGQIVMLTALDSDDSYAYSITLQDGTVMYFTAQMMGYETSIGTVNQITSASVSLAIDNDILEVTPA